MIRDEVWPEFTRMENGERNHELISELTELLDRTPGVDVKQAVDRIFRRQGLGYRVAITIADAHVSAAGIKRLFKGYEDSVAGRPGRRLGHVLHVSDLRPWMQSIADLAILEIERIQNV